MSATNSRPHPSIPSPAPTTCKYWRKVAGDALLELADAQARLALVDEDLVEVIGAKRFDFYTRVGGTALTEGAFRAKVRHQIRTGEEI